MRREAANENVSMQSSFGNVSVLSGRPQLLRSSLTKPGGPRRPAVPLCPDPISAPGRGGVGGQGPASPWPPTLLAILRLSPGRPSEPPPQGRPLAWASVFMKENELLAFLRGLRLQVQVPQQQVWAGLGVPLQSGD